MFRTIGDRRVLICSDCGSPCRLERFYSVEPSFWDEDEDGAFPLSPFYEAFLCEDCFRRIGTRVGVTR